MVEDYGFWEYVLSEIATKGSALQGALAMFMGGIVMMGVAILWWPENTRLDQAGGGGRMVATLATVVSAIAILIGIMALASAPREWRERTTPAGGDGLTAWATFLETETGTRLLQDEIDALGITSIDQISVHGVSEIGRRVAQSLAEHEASESSRGVANALGLEAGPKTATSQSGGRQPVGAAEVPALINTAEAQREHLHGEIAAAIRENN